MRVRISTLRSFVRKALREHAEGQHGRDFDHAPGYSSDADMARTQLKNIADRAMKLHSALDDSDDLPAWVLSKMAVADSYMTSLSDYLHGEMDRMQEDPEYTSEYEDTEGDDGEESMDYDVESYEDSSEYSADFESMGSDDYDYDVEASSDEEEYGEPDYAAGTEDEDEVEEEDQQQDMMDQTGTAAPGMGMPPPLPAM